MEDTFREQFLEIVGRYCDYEPNEITDDMNFREELGFNSLNFMTFLGDIEDEFDLEIDADMVMDLATVGEAMEYAKELMDDD